MTKQQIPNLLTGMRIGAVFVALVIAAAFPHARLLMFAVFTFASITDFFDGYLARKWNAVSALGTMLDPIADKLLVAVVLLYLQEYTSAPLAAVAIILCREIYISGLREFLALRGKALPVSKGGKWKTTLQFTAILLLLATLCFPMPYARLGAVLINSWNVGVLLLWAAAIMTLVSAVDYTRKAIRSL